MKTPMSPAELAARSEAAAAETAKSIDGFKFKEPPAKKLGTGFEAKELKKLTPEEKAKRRLITNLILSFIGIAILVGAVLVLT